MYVYTQKKHAHTRFEAKISLGGKTGVEDRYRYCVLVLLNYVGLGF